MLAMARWPGTRIMMYANIIKVYHNKPRLKENRVRLAEQALSWILKY